MANQPAAGFIAPEVAYHNINRANAAAESASRTARSASRDASIEVAMARRNFQLEIERQRTEFEAQLLHAKRLIHSEAAAKETLARALHAVAPNHPLIAISPDGSEMALPDLDEVRRRAYEAITNADPLSPRVVWPAKD